MNVMLAARSILFEELGQIPEDRLRALETLYQCGYIKDGRGDITKRRAVLGLPDISLSEGELAEVRRIMDDNGLARSTRNTDRSQVEGH